MLRQRVHRVIGHVVYFDVGQLDIRRAVNARGYFPNEQAALECVYMAVMSLGPTGHGGRRWMIR